MQVFSGIKYLNSTHKVWILPMLGTSFEAKATP
jgi:hypothetical protein